MTLISQEQLERELEIKNIRDACKQGEFFTNLCVKLLLEEIDRLKAGNFTDAEFQNLCHTMSEDKEAKFKQGCRAYWKKLGFVEEYAAPEGYQLVAVKIPDGWELADRVMRAPNAYEYFLANDTGVEIPAKRIEGMWQGGVRVIVRKIPEAPEGYEFTGEFRNTNLDEWYLSTDGEAMQASMSKYREQSPKRILRKKWIWPTWLTANWIAYSPMNNWWGYKEKPIQEMTGWANQDGASAIHLNAGYLDYEWPVCTDWKQSLQKNPNYKEQG